MSRLHVIRGLVYQGPPQIPETLDSNYLIFTVSIDGDIDAFLRDFASGLGRSGRDLLAHRRLPRHRRQRRVRALGVAHKRNNGYLRLSVAERDRPPHPRGAARPGGLRRLVARSAELSDAELQAEFRALMAGGK